MTLLFNFLYYFILYFIIYMLIYPPLDYLFDKIDGMNAATMKEKYKTNYKSGEFWDRTLIISLFYAFVRIVIYYIIYGM